MNNSDRILIISGLFRPDTENEIINNSKGFVQSAANAYQWKMVRGIAKNFEGTIDIINSVFVGSFPKYYKKLVFRSYVWKNQYFKNCYEIGFLNIFGLKEIIRSARIERKVKEWVKRNPEGEKIVIVYSMNSAFIKSAFRAKQKFSDIKICLICPDLPEYMNEKGVRGKLFDLIKKIDVVIQKRLLFDIDYFVFATKQMNEKVNLLRKPWCVVEGLAEKYGFIEKQYDEPSPKKIVYTGTIDARYGVVDLMKAFSEISGTEYELIICGVGANDRNFDLYIENDSRIKYLGQVSHQEALKLQREAFFLVNPRKAEGEYVEYSFPSKIIEYLSSGTPVLMYDLPGIPLEYKKHYLSIDKFSNLKEALLAAMSLSFLERVKMGHEAYQFIMNEKTEETQMGIVLDMIKNSLQNEDE